MMDVGLLGALVIAGICGPLLNIPEKLGLNVAVGEVLIGLVIGKTGFDLVSPNDRTLKTISMIGFALVMLTAGSHINLGKLGNLPVLQKVVKILLLNLVLSLALGFTAASLTAVKKWPILCVIIFSSSAAFVLPTIAERKDAEKFSTLIVQVTLADFVSSVSLAFAVQTGGLKKILIGTLAVGACAVAIFFFLRLAHCKGWILKVHRISTQKNLGLEMRISMGVLLLVAALSIKFSSSVFLAGFSIGVAIASFGMPKRLARQLFGITDGFFAPLFYVLLGTTLDLRATFHDVKNVLLIVFMVLAAAIVHFSAVLFKQPRSQALVTMAELGTPVATVTLESANGALAPGQAGAILVAALATLFISSFALKRVLGEI